MTEATVGLLANAEVAGVGKPSHSPVVVILDLPASLFLELLARAGLRFVADNGELVSIVADKVLEDSTNNRLHARRNNDGRDLVLERPLVVLVEMGVKFDVLDQILDTLREGLLYRVHHLSECIAVLCQCLLSLATPNRVPHTGR